MIHRPPLYFAPSQPDGLIPIRSSAGPVGYLCTAAGTYGGQPAWGFAILDLSGTQLDWRFRQGDAEQRAVSIFTAPPKPTFT